MDEAPAHHDFINALRDTVLTQQQALALAQSYPDDDDVHALTAALLYVVGLPVRVVDVYSWYFAHHHQHLQCDFTYAILSPSTWSPLSAFLLLSCSSAFAHTTPPTLPLTHPSIHYRCLGVRRIRSSVFPTAIATMCDTLRCNPAAVLRHKIAILWCLSRVRPAHVKDPGRVMAGVALKDVGAALAQYTQVCNVCGCVGV